MAPHRHLKTRQGYYYFRIGVPTELIPHLKRKEIVYSLNTTSLAEALDLCIVLKSAAYTLFERFRMPTALPSPMTDDQIKAFIKQYFQSCLTRFEDYIYRHIQFLGLGQEAMSCPRCKPKNIAPF